MTVGPRAVACRVRAGERTTDWTIPKTIVRRVHKAVAIGQFLDWLGTLTLEGIGTALIDGLVAGLKAGAGAVLGAITGIAGGAVDAAKKALGIASPSTIFAEIGMHTAAGMEQGVDSGAAAVAGSMEAMVEPPASAAPAAAAGGGGGSGAQYTITINAGGGDGASIADALRKLLADLGAQAGTEVPA